MITPPAELEGTCSPSKPHLEPLRTASSPPTAQLLSALKILDLTKPAPRSGMRAYVGMVARRC